MRALQWLGAAIATVLPPPVCAQGIGPVAAATAPLPATPALPPLAELQIQTWSRRFTGTGRPGLERALASAAPYIGMIDGKLRAAGLPPALRYLPVIESRYNPWARSHAGAVGLWQFMPETGSAYGLVISPWLDERRDPYKATDAAIAHLRDLHSRHHGDWLLALAAYNAGSGRVRRALAGTGGAGQWQGWSFWATQHQFRAETRQYVPQLLAVVRVVNSPERHGLRMPGPLAHPPRLRVVLPAATRLTAVARVWGISLHQIAAWNPALRWAATPPDREYAVILPAEGAAEKRWALLALPAHERSLTAQEIAGVERATRVKR